MKVFILFNLWECYENCIYIEGSRTHEFRLNVYVNLDLNNFSLIKRPNGSPLYILIHNQNRVPEQYKTSSVLRDLI